MIDIKSIIRSLDLQIKSLKKDIYSKQILLEQWECKKADLELKLLKEKETSHAN